MNDPSHCPSFKSCLIRVPGTFNSKYIAGAIPIESARVKVIQRWDGVRPAIPAQFMKQFHGWLLDEIITKMKDLRNLRWASRRFHVTRTSWIETLLNMPIVDYRKNAVALILVPYLLNIRKMSESDAFNVINGWLRECSKLKPLDSDFHWRVKYALRYVMRKQLRPLSFRSLKERNKSLYDLLQQRSKH